MLKNVLGCIVVVNHCQNKEERVKILTKGQNDVTDPVDHVIIYFKLYHPQENLID